MLILTEKKNGKILLTADRAARVLILPKEYILFLNFSIKLLPVINNYITDLKKYKK